MTLLPDQVKGDIIELGAGWGGITLALARHYPQHTVIAIENCPPVWLFCWLRVKLSRLENIRVQFGDLYTANISEAGLVYCYLYPEAMGKIFEKFCQLQPHCVFISNTFSLPGIEAAGISRAGDLWRSRVYLYRSPASPSSL